MQDVYLWETLTDLQIYHDGSNSFIDNSTGNLTIDPGTHLLLKTATGESLANFFANGANELFYDNSKKLSTGSTGITVTGNIDGAANMFLQDYIYHSGDGNTYMGFAGTDTVCYKN